MGMWVTAAVLSSSTLAAGTFVNAHRLFMRAVKRVANTCGFQTAAAAAAALLLLCARCDGSPRYFNLVSYNLSLCTSQCMGVNFAGCSSGTCSTPCAKQHAAGQCSSTGQGHT
jgi:hypothetical protein